MADREMLMLLVSSLVAGQKGLKYLMVKMVEIRPKNGKAGGTKLLWRDKRSGS